MRSPLLPLAAALAVLTPPATVLAADAAPVVAAGETPPRPALHLELSHRSWTSSRASPTALDHRFATDGLTAQVGYLCGIGGIGPDASPDHGGPASTFGRPGTFLGASVGYVFR